MWVQTRMDEDVWDEREDRDPDRLVNLTYCRAVRVRGVRAVESDGVGSFEPVDDTSNAADTAGAVGAPEQVSGPQPEAPTYRRWEVVAALAAERAAPGLRTTEILAAVATEDVARRLFREVRRALLDGRAGIDLSAAASETGARRGVQRRGGRVPS